MTTKNLGGRPRKYKTEDLLEALNNYVAEKAPLKVTITELEKHTAYPIQAWRFNSEIKSEIDKINKKLSDFSKLSGGVDDVNLLTIANAEDIVQTNYHNKEKLIESIQNLIDMYQLNLKKCLKLERLECELEDLKKENENLKRSVQFYENKLNQMMIKSHNSYERLQNNLEKDEVNIIEFSKTETTFKDLFKDLK